jgi:beta-phosphoglucomutase-like phosphatase (HAD superfamily)
MDGLMFDTMPMHVDCWVQVCREEGLVCDESIIWRLSGSSNDTVGRALLNPLEPDIPEAKFKSMAKRKQMLFMERFTRNIRLFPGVRRWLEYFASRGYRQAVASSAAARHIQMALSEVGLGRFFDVVLSGEVDVRRCKPAPDIFLLAGRQLGVEPARCVVLEDAEVGVRAAKEAGMRCIAVTNTQAPEVLRAADLVTNSLAEVSPEICDRWFGLVLHA